MAERYEVHLAGEGGQGLILAGVILAEAAALHDGKNVAQTQSYGPEARGGASGSEVVISDDEIDYPKIIEADVLLAMSQKACDEYSPHLKEHGLLIVDSVHVERLPSRRAVSVPITKIAEEVTGRRITANIVALGLMVGITHVVTIEAIEAAVTDRAPEGTQAINLAALRAGFKAASELAQAGQESTI